ncbi:hypothetical protein MNB_SV-13-1764 [hydrothermal vent metagenome]|uniref:DUF2339 domain-containing protein n=1 Tax=hydrothermal vent metagenome TaxID=652676 RepID=A0A1W1CIZ5_9ZZZZ
MNTSALWILLLGIWIFFLQKRVKHLEEILEAMTEKKVIKPKVAIEKPKEAIQKVPEIVRAQPSSLNTSPKIEKTLIKEEIKPKEPQKPKKPSKILLYLKNYFTKGNVLVRIGSVILFFGLAFLVKYATAQNMISIEIRLAFVALVSMALIALGWKLREREGGYGQVLQGLGIAILYLLIYATAKFYDLLSLDIAFVFMLGVVIMGSLLAVFEDALPLALFATAGGFFVPILTSSGEGSHVILFSYYALLNLGIFAIAWYKSWRLLNLLGFFFTFIISGFWSVLNYNPALFLSTEPFLLLYFAMYLSISILFTMKQPYKPKNLVDASLVFGLPVIAFPLQLNLVSSFEYGSAITAIILGLLYLGLYFYLKNTERTKLLSQSFLALAVVFLSISIPYLFNADASATLWSLESAGIIWLALKQDKKISRYFGQVLLLVAIFTYPSSVESFGISFPEFLGYLILITAVFISAYLLDTHRPKLSDVHRVYSKVLVIMGMLLWSISIGSQLVKFNIPAKDTLLWSLILFVPIVLLIIRHARWQLFVRYLPLYFPLGILFSLPLILGTSHPFEDLGALHLATFISLGYGLLYMHYKRWKYAKELHSLLLWFIAIVLGFETFYHLNLLFNNTIISLLEYTAYLSLSILLLASAYFLEKYQQYLSFWDRHLSKIFLALGLVLYFTTTSTQLMRFQSFYNYEMLSAFVLGAWILTSIAKGLKWQILSTVLQGYFIVGIFFFMLILFNGSHPFKGLGIILFGFFIALNYLLLYRYDKVWKINTLLHIASLWFISILGIAHFSSLSQRYALDSSLTSIMMVLTPLVFNMILLIPKSYKGWLEYYRHSYQLIGSAGLIVFLFVWTVSVFSIATPTSQLSIPLFNLLDITQILVLANIYYWTIQNKSFLPKEYHLQLYGLFIFLVLILINVIFARAIHTFTAIPYNFFSLWQNAYFQTGLSILWSSIAIILMLLSKKFHSRPLWIAGFSLLILIVLKLFFIELAQSGTIERIISFMVVGTLLLVIGYFVPLPPNKEEDKSENNRA